MSEASKIVAVAELDLALSRERWDFAETRAAEIAAHWAETLREKPALYNGRVLLLRRRTFEKRPDGRLKLTGVYFETDYAAFIALRALDPQGGGIENCFSMAALRSGDGAFLLGEMAPHTYNAGKIYFPAGTPDPSDIFGDKVDLDASARRELFEETGVDADEAIVSPGWTLVFAPQRVACMKAMTLALSAEEAKARIEAFLAQDPHAEFSRIHIVRAAADIDEERTPSFVADYIRAEFGSPPVRR